MEVHKFKEGSVILPDLGKVLEVTHSLIIKWLVICI